MSFQPSPASSNLPTRSLYRTATAFIGGIGLIALLSWVFQAFLITRLPHPHEQAPKVSPNHQLEFESGALRRSRESPVNPNPGGTP